MNEGRAGGPHSVQMEVVAADTEAPRSRDGSREATTLLVPQRFLEGNEAYINER